MLDWTDVTSQGSSRLKSFSPTYALGSAPFRNSIYAEFTFLLRTEIEEMSYPWSNKAYYYFFGTNDSPRIKM